jgi:hypothetical protein
MLLHHHMLELGLACTQFASPSHSHAVATALVLLLTSDVVIETACHHVEIRRKGGSNAGCWIELLSKQCATPATSRL